MTRNEIDATIFGIIIDALDRGHAVTSDVDRIWAAIGRLSPEPKAKPEVPFYDPKKVKRVGTLVEKHQFTQDQRDAALAALRAVGLL